MVTTIVTPATRTTPVADSGTSSDGFTSFSVESSHPYYLHPSDSPGTVLVTCKFNGTGYGGWRRSMLIGLSCKNKLGLVNGTLSRPAENSPYYEPWCRANDMVLAWILNGLELEIRESVMYTEIAEKLWKDIEKRYGQANGTKVHQIRKEIASISQGSSNIASYFSKIKKLWDELAYSITYPDCSCGCKENFQKMEEEQRLHQFLMGLNEVYSGVRRNILMMNPLPDVDTAYSMLINDESQLEAHTISPSFNTEAASFSTGIQKPYSSNPSNNFQQRRQNYPQKVNFDNKRDNRNNNGNLFCRYCKKHGHVIGDCRKLQYINSLNNNTPNCGNLNHGNFSSQQRRTVACVQGSEGKTEAKPEAAGKSTEGRNGQQLQSSPEQLNQMMNMFQQMKNTCTEQGTSYTIYADAAQQESGKTLSASNSKVLKILTYNVWFADIEMPKRMKALSNLIALHSPDVICFQEVTQEIYDIFQHSSWWKIYSCSISNVMELTRGYFCMQLSKLAVKSYSCKPFSNSIMGRELCIAELEVQKDMALVVATSHLESPCPGPPKWDQMYSKERVEQAKEAVDLLERKRNVIFCGDMNWDDKLDGQFPLPDGWIDAWGKMKPEEIGWTYDTKSNKMLSANRTLQKRLDRFVCKLQDFCVSDIKMIGKDAIPNLTYIKEKKVKSEVKRLTLPVLPSDHYGLLLEISPK